MAFDAVTTAAVAAELQQRLQGGRVDKIVQPSTFAVALLLRAGGANHWLLLSAHPQYARVGIVGERMAKAFDEPSAFVMLLRKHLIGARLDSARQIARDRVLRLTWQSHGPPVALVAEIMAKHSNIILVDDKDIILGALKPITAAVSRYRVVLPRHLYVPPPVPTRPAPHQSQPKLDAFTVDVAEVERAMAELPGDTTIAAAAVETLAGVGPQLAREAAYRLTGDATYPLSRLLDRSSPQTRLSADEDVAPGSSAAGSSSPAAPSVAAFLQQLRDLMAPAPWRPSIVRRDDAVLGWAAYPLLQHGIQPRLYDSISEVIDEVHGGLESGDALGSVRAGVQQSIATHRARLARKAASLRAGLCEQSEIDALRAQGEAVLAFAHEIAPGQTQLTVPEGFEGAPPVIALDPRLTPSENAQAFFGRYRKLRDAAAKVPPLLEEVEESMQFLDAAALYVEQADSMAAIKEVRDDLAAAGFSAPGEKAPARQPPKSKGGKYHPGGKAPPRHTAPAALRFITRDGLDVLVGRSARQNEVVTFDLASSGDLWFHARGLPGSHVVLKTGGRTPPDSSVEAAAALAAYYSRGRGSTTVPVDVVPARNVRRIKGGKPGLVRISGEATVNVRPRSSV